MKKWIKPDKRPMSERFICPYCRQTVYSRTKVTKFDGRREIIAYFPFCPWCAKQVLRSDSFAKED